MNIDPKAVDKVMADETHREAMRMAQHALNQHAIIATSILDQQANLTSQVIMLANHILSNGISSEDEDAVEDTAAPSVDLRTEV